MLSGNVCFTFFVCERGHVSDVYNNDMCVMIVMFIGIILIPIILYRYVMILLHRLVGSCDLL